MQGRLYHALQETQLSGLWNTWAQTIWQQRRKSPFISRKEKALTYFIVYSALVAYVLWKVFYVTALQVVNRRNAKITSNIKLYMFSKSVTLEIRTNYLEVDTDWIIACLQGEKNTTVFWMII